MNKKTVEQILKEKRCSEREYEKEEENMELREEAISYIMNKNISSIWCLGCVFFIIWLISSALIIQQVFNNYSSLACIISVFLCGLIIYIYYRYQRRKAEEQIKEEV